jgi:hypothetical protein
MLDITTAFSNQVTASSPFGEFIAGRVLAHSKKGATLRALWAADLVAGSLRLVEPTTTQAATLCGVCVPYVRAALHADFERRQRLERGSVSLSEIVTTPKPVLTLADAWDFADDAQRVAFMKAVGTADVWNALALAIA